MGKLFDLIFRRHDADAADTSRLRRVLVANRRAELAALHALEIQLRVAEAITPRGKKNGR